jgi:hypothetical protein
MSGLQLASMHASDMLDVIHYIFEEDMRFSTAEESKATDAIRVSLYRDFYETEYKYAASANRSTAQSGEFDGFDSVTPYSPTATKPYIPPTQFDPDMGLPGLIEPPIG